MSAGFKITFYIGIFIIGIFAALALGQIILRRNFGFFTGKEVRKEITAIREDAGIVGRKIMQTNGTKHSVPLEEIIGGGPL